RRRDVGVERHGFFRNGGEARDEKLTQRVSLERECSREHLVQDHAKRIHIAPSIGRLAFELLWSRVARRTMHISGQRAIASLLGQLGQTEIRYVHMVVPINE